ncbi:inactive ubiquitin carboxyl-terminal hydrolase 54-like isoform X1 [Lates japonicus]|uniref:Inactive ubiquitin carboxyl-terminal hydrolase 54-like isoform X1 n=1 Tax=Lates japonicus TaxID=270547 RepID=A0AAD3RAA7_LATJO|nr:inactive ubiquitin carboxyl-terminal hydrolase 54-like isoform X1 [Lates japonicus]
MLRLRLPSTGRPGLPRKRCPPASQPQPRGAVDRPSLPACSDVAAGRARSAAVGQTHLKVAGSQFAAATGLVCPSRTSSLPERPPSLGRRAAHQPMPPSRACVPAHDSIVRGKRVCLRRIIALRIVNKHASEPNVQVQFRMRQTGDVCEGQRTADQPTARSEPARRPARQLRLRPGHRRSKAARLARRRTHHPPVARSVVGYPVHPARCLVNSLCQQPISQVWFTNEAEPDKRPEPKSEHCFRRAASAATDVRMLRKPVLFRPRPGVTFTPGKGDSFERCVSEAELLLDQSVRLEQAGEVAASLSAVNEAVSKLRPMAAESGASSHSRLQRCMRRARSLQQRMQLQKQQDSEAVRQQPQQPEQQQEEGQQLQEQSSEKPLALQILLTNRQGDQSATSQDQQALPLSPCLVKPPPPTTNSVSDPASSTVAPTCSPREDSRTGGPCSCTEKPLSNTGSLPALCVDNWEQSPLDDLAPPLLPDDADHSAQWARKPPVPIPAQAPPPSRLYSRTPSPVNTNDRCHLMMQDEPYYIRQPQTPPPVSSPATRLAPTPPTCPTRNWSCLHLDMPDVVDSPDPPTYTPPDLPFSAPPPPVNQPGRTSSPPPSQDYRAALPVERWAENVNRYYGSQTAAGGGGGGGEGEEAVPSEELSELDSLYQASLLAPSMHRGSRGVSPQPTSNKPAFCSMSPLNRPFNTAGGLRPRVGGFLYPPAFRLCLLRDAKSRIMCKPAV